MIEKYGDKEKKKVLIVACDNLGIGGIQSIIVSIINSLTEEFTFDVVSFSNGPDFYDDVIASYGCNIFRIPNKGVPGSLRGRADYYIRYRRRYMGIMKIIKENGPYNAIHCNNYEEAGVLLKATFRAGIPIRISHCHNNKPMVKGKRLHKLYVNNYKRMIMKYSSNRIACSRLAGEYLFGYDSTFQVIENAIDLTRFNESCEQAKSAWSFINVGRWGEQKNQLFLIDAFWKITQRHPESVLTLIGYGDNDYYSKINERIKEYGIEGNIKFYPGDADIPSLLGKNNVFLFPSTFEGLGIVLIEAQAASLKCFASSAVPEEANLGYVEYLPLDADVWADAVIRHVENNGSKRYPVNMESYDINNIAKKYRAIYLGE